MDEAAKRSGSSGRRRPGGDRLGARIVLLAATAVLGTIALIAFVTVQASRIEGVLRRQAETQNRVAALGVVAERATSYVAAIGRALADPGAVVDLELAENRLVAALGGVRAGLAPADALPTSAAPSALSGGVSLAPIAAAVEEVRIQVDLVFETAPQGGSDVLAAELQAVGLQALGTRLQTAVRQTSDGEIEGARLLLDQARAMRRTLATGSALLGAALIGLVVFLARRFRLGLEASETRLLAGFDALRRGRLDHQIRREAGEGLARLIGTFNDTALSLRRQRRRWREEAADPDATAAAAAEASAGAERAAARVLAALARDLERDAADDEALRRRIAGLATFARALDRPSGAAVPIELGQAVRAAFGKAGLPDTAAPRADAVPIEISAEAERLGALLALLAEHVASRRDDPTGLHAVVRPEPAEGVLDLSGPGAAAGAFPLAAAAQLAESQAGTLEVGTTETGRWRIRLGLPRVEPAPDEADQPTRPAESMS